MRLTTWMWRACAAGLIVAGAACGDASTATKPLEAASLAAGDDFTCALNHTGMAFCWGLGTSGQLGNGQEATSTTPVRVSGGPYRAIAAGGKAVCGLRFGGTVDCWGEIPRSCCGFSTDTVLLPTRVSTSVRFTEIAVAPFVACGIATSGGGYCWGFQGYGELGNGVDGNTSLSSPTPILGSGLVFTHTATGFDFGCGTKSDQTAWCWGLDANGNLGADSAGGAETTQPTRVATDLRFVSITAGVFYACGVTTTGSAACWGDNTGGVLGDGTTHARSVPTAVAGSPAFRAIFGGSKDMLGGHTCALDASGAAFCWGLDQAGQLGAEAPLACGLPDFPTPCSLTPVAVQGGQQFTTLAVGRLHTCGMIADGQVYCWGENTSGQLGNGTMDGSTAPVLASFTP